MPLDVIMPALGMAQESGVIVSWHKKPGDAVAEGDVLFEVETDKATMEVEAQGAGFLAAVTAGEGDEVPVGKVIARIAATSEEAEAVQEPETGPAAPAGAPADGDDVLPDGAQVIMPTLGMAQDTGLLVGWLVEPGGKVAADEPLFEVETDKSTMEVPAGVDGYLAAQLAQPGEEVPTGQVIAIVSSESVDTPIVRAAAAAPAPASAPPAQDTAAPEKPAPAKPVAAVSDPGGRILASPKARRLALERGLDLARLVKAGHPQPYHAKDLDTLAALHDDTQASPAGGTSPSVQARHLTADVAGDGFAAFAQWAAETADLRDAPMLLAGLAGACLARDRPIVAHEAFGRRRLFVVPQGPLHGIAETDEGAPDLILRDLRHMRISSLCLGAEEAPTLSVTASGKGLSVTLECGPHHLSAAAAVSLLSEFAGRLEQPLRHLL